MNETLKTILAPDPSSGSPFWRRAVSGHPFAETLARLKEALQAEDLWLIHEIDPQLLLQRGGYRIPAARQLLFFHPRFLVRLLERDPSALVEVPLKLVILEAPDGTVTLRCPDVAAAFAQYPGLEGLGAELDAICQRLVGTVVQA